MGRPELAGDPRFATIAARKRNEDALEGLVSDWTATRTAEDVTATLQAAAIPAFMSARNNDLAESPHLQARSYFVEHEHAEVGRRIHAGIPWRMTTHQSRVRTAAPCLGADTDVVLRDVCGYDDAGIARLRDAGVLT
jgi:crotonobetainyl-CoA:carnitine CoA-transferase CaiB-like acyl-CoA transferase